MKLLLVFLLVVSCALAYPRPPLQRRSSQYRAAARLRRAPLTAAGRRTMLISGFYRPIYAHRRQGFEPETAMTAFATGDNVAAGSYLGAAGCPTCAEQADNGEFLGAPEPNEEPIVPEYPPVNEPLADVPIKAPVKKPQPAEEDVSDESEVYVPKKGRKGSDTYFPIVFGSGGGRSGAGGSGGVTAIANSYSSGKGGVANSHATAYGAGSGPSRRSKRPPVDADEDEE